MGEILHTTTKGKEQKDQMFKTQSTKKTRGGGSQYIRCARL